MDDFQTGMATSSKSPFMGTRALPPIMSTPDRKFFDSLQKYIQDEKKSLTRPSEVPDEQRYNIYSSAFDKVIERTPAYKMILSTIKKEYDDIISAAMGSDREGLRTQRRLLAKAAEPAAAVLYKMRAAELQERIAIIQENTAQLHTQLWRLQESRIRRRAAQQSKELPAGKIPGLTLPESVNLATLQPYLEKLERKQADLQRKKQSQYVSQQVAADLQNRMQCAQEHRDQLAAENLSLDLRHRKLVFLHEAFSSWEKSERAVPLSEFLPSILEKSALFKARDPDYHDVSLRASEEDDPAKAEESKLLSDYVDRFTQLFKGGEYEAAALHAARSPHGILRNLETMGRFKAVRRYEGGSPPALLYFQALMMAVPPGQKLPGGGLAVEGVRAALQNGCLEQVVHWVTQHRLTFSEALGDVLSAHAQEDAAAADACLALAQLVYSARELHGKAAVCLGRRGLTQRLVEFICSHQAFSQDDCLYVVRSCPSVALLQALMQGPRGPGVLPLGRAACSLMGTPSEELLYQLLESMQACGTLEKAIVEDRSCSAEGWGELAGRCRETGRPQLALAISTAQLISSAQAISPPM